MAESQKSVDLEKELTCSICTEVLYQPLTCLDCLHTFCGSCLKEWFAWQASNLDNTHPFTCPSCRATVRETRPNATVTTLLDMFLQANPTRGRTQTEKDDIAKSYKPGDNVLPAVDRVEGNEAEEDRRLVQEVREMSLADAQRRRPSPRDRPSSRETRERSRETRESDERHRRRREEERRRRREAQQAAGSQNRATADPRSQARQIEHQSSLRSLLSSSDGESAMEEEILRQIIDGGLLEGINVDDLDGAQEDELSERIAEAYRQRHTNRTSPRQARRSDIAGTSDRSLESRHTRSHSAQGERAELRRPPVSRPHLLEASHRPHHSRRLSDQSRRRTSPTPRASRSTSEEVARQATRSATDLSNRPQSSHREQTRARQVSYTRRSTTEPEPPRISDMWRSGAGRGESHATSHRSTISQTLTDSPTAATFGVSSHASSAPTSSENRSREEPPTSQPASDQSARPSSSSSSAPRTRPSLFPEPSISCDRCGKQNIEYELHKYCSKCNDGNYNLCLRCFHLGRGCLHWFGFGSAAQYRYETQSPPSTRGSSHERPHVLTGHKYLRPKQGSVQLMSPNSDRRLTSDDPSKRLQDGMFCDICHSFANECFWKCDSCNDGEWDFCNNCVNQGKCCTHALLPVAHKSSTRAKAADPSTTPPPKTASVFSGPAANDDDPYRPLTFSTKCDICSYPVQPSTTRYHCPEHNDGDYDICTSCYLKLVASGKISKENGHNGWRRCPQGHRMIIVGFEDRPEGQKRVVVRDLVGGHALKDEVASSAPNGDWSWTDSSDGKKATRPRSWRNVTVLPSDESSSTAPAHTTARFPPDGGVGMRVLAAWSYYPEDGVQDELMFPKGAEVWEVDDINGDWFWGVYAGAKGLFPGQYVRVIDVVTM